MPKSTIRLYTFVVTLLIIPSYLTGCGIGDPIGHDRTIEGTYTLRQFNGVNVPGSVYEDASTKVEVLSGFLVLDTDTRYREPISLRRTDKTNAKVSAETQEDAGTYVVSGNTITFISADPEVGTYSGTWTVNTITYTSGGLSATFLRQ